MKKIETDPVFLLTPERVKSIKYPYSQEIQVLTSKYNLNESDTVKPFHGDSSEVSKPTIDLELK